MAERHGRTVILSREDGEGSLFTPAVATRETLRCAQGDEATTIGATHG
jgi:hypothetical protein